MQTTNKIMMIRPQRFVYNEQTAQTNSFQTKSSLSEKQSQNQALQEFEQFAQALIDFGVSVKIFNDTLEPHTPDSIFPNNWVSLHEPNSMVLYPLAHINRRSERRPDIISYLQKLDDGKDLIDLTRYEAQNVFLESTGSMVLDRVNRVAYCALSDRSHSKALEHFCERMNFSPFTFHTKQINNLPVYHTNVIMSVGEHVAVVCFEVLSNKTEADAMRAQLEHTQHQIVEISVEQMCSFCGNLLELRNSKNETAWVLSQRAWNALNQQQQSVLCATSAIISSPLNTIEDLGGGSARCMIAEIF